MLSSGRYRKLCSAAVLPVRPSVRPVLVFKSKNNKKACKNKIDVNIPQLCQAHNMLALGRHIFYLCRILSMFIGTHCFSVVI